MAVPPPDEPTHWMTAEGQQVGPEPFSVVTLRVGAGQIPPSTLVWWATAPTWMTYDEATAPPTPGSSPAATGRWDQPSEPEPHFAPSAAETFAAPEPTPAPTPAPTPEPAAEWTAPAAGAWASSPTFSTGEPGGGAGNGLPASTESPSAPIVEIPADAPAWEPAPNDVVSAPVDRAPAPEDESPTPAFGTAATYEPPTYEPPAAAVYEPPAPAAPYEPPAPAAPYEPPAPAAPYEPPAFSAPPAPADASPTTIEPAAGGFAAPLGDRPLSSSEPPAFAPAAFAPAGFDPAAVEPTPLEPTAFEPAAFEPAAFEPTPFEPSPFEPSPFEPSPFEPTTVDPGSFAPSAPDGAGQPTQSADTSREFSADLSAPAVLATATAAVPGSIEPGPATGASTDAPEPQAAWLHPQPDADRTPSQLDDEFVALVARSLELHRNSAAGAAIDEAVLAAIIAALVDDGYVLIDISTDGASTGSSINNSGAHHLRFEEPEARSRVSIALEVPAPVGGDARPAPAQFVVGYSEQVPNFNQVGQALRQEVASAFVVSATPGTVTFDAEIASGYVTAKVDLLLELDRYVGPSFEIDHAEIRRQLAAIVHTLQSFTRARFGN